MFSKYITVFNIICILFIIYCTYLSATLVIKGEIELTNDIGRDFLLLQEVDQKKIIFIGARSNTSGIFHGTFWTYLNYPAYLLGHGNPVIVGWFWVILGMIFLITTFFMLRKLFDTTSALLGVSLLAVNLIPETNNIFGQQAGFYFMPVFLFTMYMYGKKRQIYYLIFHLLTAGIFIHLNIGVGGLFAILSLILCLGIIVKNRKWKHLLAFFTLPAVLINFILFEIKHNFNISKSLLNLAGEKAFYIPFSLWFENRMSVAFNMLLSPANPYNIRLIIVVLIILFTLITIFQKRKQKDFLLLMLYYFYGYIIMTYFTKGILLKEFVYLLGPLTVLWLSALTNTSYKVLFIPIFLVIIFINFTYARNYLKWKVENFIGKDHNSWIALNTVAQSILDDQKGSEFAYYVYSPDSYAYQQRYAFIYAFSHAKAKSIEYAKKSTTYVIVTPPPELIPFMREDWWIQNQAKITSLPVEIKKFPGGYMTEKFQLTLAEQNIPHDPNIELRLHFR